MAGKGCVACVMHKSEDFLAFTASAAFAQERTRVDEIVHIYIIELKDVWTLSQGH